MAGVRDVRVKPVKIKLDKERSILYDFNALASIEEEYESIEKALEELQKGKAKAIRAILWAGLLHEDENLTLKDVGKMFTLKDLPEIAEAVGKAIALAMPEGEKGKNIEGPSEKETPTGGTGRG